MHAAAVPDADRSTLKQPATAAREMLGVMLQTLHEMRSGKGAAA
jgi:hypothetical protein